MKRTRVGTPYKQIVVISHTDDLHVPFVQRHLNSRCIIIDPASVTAGAELSFYFNGGKVIPTYEDVVLDNVGCVWYRKPEEIDPLALPVSEAYIPYSLTAITKFTKLLRSNFREALWVSDYYAIQRANNKDFQLEVAAGLGFNVPETLTTSSPQKAEQFLQEQEYSIIKSMAIKFPVIGNKGYGFFTKRVRRGDKVNLNNLHLAPAIFQRAIETVTDWRVTVVGNKVFASKVAAVRVSDEAPVRDWRFEHIKGEAKFKAADASLPKDIRAKCLKLVKSLGLMYGAIDLVEDTEGAIWFLEINPNGQWAFIEEETGQPIGKAFADLFERALRMDKPSSWRP